MSHSHVSVPGLRNHLLASLPAEDLQRLWPRLKLVQLPIHHILMVPDEPITTIYFPESGWASMLVLADKSSAEVGIVGNEGMLGLPLLLRASSGSVQVMLQATGIMLQMDAAAFRQALRDIPALEELLLRYALAFQEQVTQTAACNGHHTLNQRLARWLLMAHDRAERDEFPITQEFLALMLCVHRPGVTAAARLLQQAGVIRYSQGRMTIINREELEAAACTCYRIVQSRFERLLGIPRG